MKIAIDLDHTLLGDAGRQVRPGMVPLLQRLRAEGHALTLWSSASRARTEFLLDIHGLAPLFDRVHCRENYDPGNADALKDLNAIGADALIDDERRHVDFARQVGKLGIQVAHFHAGLMPPDDLAHVLPAIALAPPSLTGGPAPRVRGRLTTLLRHLAANARRLTAA